MGGCNSHSPVLILFMTETLSKEGIGYFVADCFFMLCDRCGPGTGSLSLGELLLQSPTQLFSFLTFLPSTDQLLSFCSLPGAHRSRATAVL